MDNNFDNTPKDNNAPVSLSKETGAEGQRPDSNGDQSGAKADAGRQYTDPNAGQQPYNGQQYQYGQNQLSLVL